MSTFGTSLTFSKNINSVLEMVSGKVIVEMDEALKCDYNGSFPLC